MSDEFIEGKQLMVYSSEAVARRECEIFSKLDQAHSYIYQKVEDGWEVRQLDLEE